MKWLITLIITGTITLQSSASDLIASSPTLSKIAATGQIAIGYSHNEVPFSYLVNGQPTGYTIDLCLQVIENLKKTLDLPNLKVNFVPVTTTSRFILVRNGNADIECGVTTNTPERRRQVAFSYPHFLTATRYVSLAQKEMRSLQDLAGKSVASTTGTVNIAQLNEINRTQKLNISVILSRTHEEAFAKVASGQAAAFVMDDVLLAGLVSSATDPMAFRISEATLSSPEPYGLMMPPNDPIFVEQVNRALVNIYKSKDIYTLYDKWFLQPFPPDNRVLNLPLAPELAAIFTHPEQYKQ